MSAPRRRSGLQRGLVVSLLVVVTGCGIPADPDAVTTRDSFPTPVQTPDVVPTAQVVAPPPAAVPAVVVAEAMASSLRDRFIAAAAPGSMTVAPGDLSADCPQAGLQAADQLFAGAGDQATVTAREADPSAATGAFELSAQVIVLPDADQAAAAVAGSSGAFDDPAFTGCAQAQFDQLLAEGSPDVAIPPLRFSHHEVRGSDVRRITISVPLADGTVPAFVSDLVAVQAGAVAVRIEATGNGLEPFPADALAAVVAAVSATG